ncbi:hypothetical protein THAOC_24866, partial [Thalassiosira oceanica]
VIDTPITEMGFTGMAIGSDVQGPAVPTTVRVQVTVELLDAGH